MSFDENSFSDASFSTFHFDLVSLAVATALQSTLKISERVKEARYAKMPNKYIAFPMFKRK
ncbi:hypothetical protein N9112_00080 [bacterium]|nr:hypothetical protein [bacterium]